MRPTTSRDRRLDEGRSTGAPDDDRGDGLVRQIAYGGARALDARPTWTLRRDSRSERAYPIGTVERIRGAAERRARRRRSCSEPKTAVIRTGGAACGPDRARRRVLRPVLEAAGLPRRVGLVRSRSDGARVSSSPQRIPLVILRGKGDHRRARGLAAENGVRPLAHAEGGGVLYVPHRLAEKTMHSSTRAWTG